MFVCVCVCLSVFVCVCVVFECCHYIMSSKAFITESEVEKYKKPYAYRNTHSSEIQMNTQNSSNINYINIALQTMPQTVVSTSVATNGFYKKIETRRNELLEPITQTLPADKTPYILYNEIPASVGTSSLSCSSNLSLSQKIISAVNPKTYFSNDDEDIESEEGAR